MLQRNRPEDPMADKARPLVLWSGSDAASEMMRPECHEICRQLHESSVLLRCYLAIHFAANCLQTNI